MIYHTDSLSIMLIVLKSKLSIAINIARAHDSIIIGDKILHSTSAQRELMSLLWGKKKIEKKPLPLTDYPSVYFNITFLGRLRSHQIYNTNVC